MATRRPERVLSEPVLRALVRRSDDAGLIDESGAYGEAAADAAKAASAESFRAALLAALNDARKSAQLAPFTLEARQSELDGQLTPHFFEASFEQNEAKADLIALGALAGWDVQGTIRDGGIYAAAQPSTADASRWLNTALDSPLARPCSIRR